MKILEKMLTVVSVALVMLGIASIESTPIILPIVMILGGGAWLIFAANAYSWER